MCGISGTVGTGAQADVVARMAEAQRHRGPDQSGLWSDDRCILGHRRLAVIDLTTRGCQPMADSSGRLHLVFNGEIYNFQSLRRDLEGLGHRFRSDTDSEVILYAYRQWGTACVERLRGMFAFAIWDADRRHVFAARDRVGKKPFFFAEVGDRVAFASEIQGVLADRSVPREIDWEAIDAYLAWGYVPAPATGFRHIKKLDPAHWMTIDVTGDLPVVKTERYWNLEYEPKSITSGQESKEELRELLTEAVRLRMISDVPLGAFLSGGVDSSIIVGLMAELSPTPIKTFSIGFDEARWNELDHARRIARLWSTDHHEEVVRPDALGVLPLLVRHYGEPYSDSSAIPTYYLAQIARREVTVALNGDGADESFAGYDRYRANALAARLGALPGSGTVSSFLARALPDGHDPKGARRRARRFLEVAREPMAARYARWIGHFSEAEKNVLYRGPLRQLLDGHRPLEWFEELFETSGATGAVDSAMSVDVRSYLPYDLLAKVDITSMASSLEARSPFLDHEVMEMAARLPSSSKLRRGIGKAILKDAFSDLLPSENVNRRKMGFGVPVGDWFRGPLRELLGEALEGSDSRIAAYLDPEGLGRLIEDHLAGRTENTGKLWTLLMLELWHREVVEAGPSMGG